MLSTNTPSPYNPLQVLPAHETKHLAVLEYPLRDDIIFHLAQSDNGANNGSALWLGGQVLTAFLTDVLSTPTPTNSSPSISSNGHHCHRRRSRAIELGSGVGLSALALAAHGWSVLATDMFPVLHSVLRENIMRNNSDTGGNAGFLGTVQARALDWSVPPENWVWNDPESVTDPSDAYPITSDSELLGPPFDLIITSDTVYSKDLVAPLLRTIKHLITLSTTPSPSTSESGMTSPTVTPKRKHKNQPLVYLALERRDPALVDYFFAQARDAWGMNTQRIPTRRVRRAMVRSGLGLWKKQDWEDVEIWRLSLRDSTS